LEIPLDEHADLIHPASREYRLAKLNHSFFYPGELSGTKVICRQSQPAWPPSTFFEEEIEPNFATLL
jgi:hypothetical protein